MCLPFIRVVHRETHCIWRYRNRAKWVIHDDIDEFMQPLVKSADGTRARLVDTVHHLETEFPLAAAFQVCGTPDVSIDPFVVCVLMSCVPFYCRWFCDFISFEIFNVLKSTDRRCKSLIQLQIIRQAVLDCNTWVVDYNKSNANRVD